MFGDFKTVLKWIWRHLPKLDMFGESVLTDPARFPKTREGAIISLLVSCATFLCDTRS